MGEFQVQSDGDLPQTNAERRLFRRRALAVALACALVIAAAGALIPIQYRVHAAGYVTSEQYAEVRPAAAGRVLEIAARSGQRVQAGDLLVQLENAEEAARLEEAGNQLDKAKADLERKRAEMDERRRKLAVDIDLAKLRSEHASIRHQRASDLHAKGVVSKSDLENERLKAQLAAAELASLTNQDMALLSRELDILAEEVQSRLNAVDQASARLKAREIRAPIAGQVLRHEFVVGELVRPETLLMEIFGGERLVLKLRIPERNAARVAPGHRYVARLASRKGWTDAEFEGEVRAMRNIIQSDGAVTYRIAYCSFDPGTSEIPPGTTATAVLYCGRTSILAFLLDL